MLVITLPNIVFENESNFCKLDTKKQEFIDLNDNDDFNINLNFELSDNQINSITENLQGEIINNHYIMDPQFQQVLESLDQLDKSYNIELEIERLSNQTSSKRVHLRRDVLNKAIFRAFKKFYNKLFK